MINRKVLKVNGVKIFMLDTQTDKPSILCLHGRWGRAQTWSELINRYKDRFRIIAPDQRGHGLSDKPRRGYRADDFAADLQELLRKLDCGPAIVMGHSMGARMAAYLAALYPEQVEALALLDEPADGPDREYAMPVDEKTAHDGLTAGWPVPFATYHEALQFLKRSFEPDSNVRYFAESLTESADGYDFLFSRYAMAAIAAEWKSWYDLLPQIKCPVLLVRATESWCLSPESARKMQKMIQNGTYFEVSGSDHMVYADNPDEFYLGFDRWLAGLKG